jgi:hypothetical protein
MDDCFREGDSFSFGFREQIEVIVRKRELRARLNLQVLPKIG